MVVTSESGARQKRKYSEKKSVRRQETPIKNGLGRAGEAGGPGAQPRGQQCVLGGEVHLQLAGRGRDKAAAGPFGGWGRRDRGAEGFQATTPSP